MRFSCHCHAPAAVLVLFALCQSTDASAIAYVPPYVAVINQPLVIPTDGVLAVGTVDALSGVPSTAGALDSVATDAGDPVAGAASEFEVSLGDSGAVQTISLWTPEQSFVVGSYRALGLDEYGSGYSSSFSVATTESAPLDATLGAAELKAIRVPYTQVPCGETYGLGAEVIPLYLTTYYGQVPALTTELASSAPDGVLSQYFFRGYRPGVDEPQFGPYYFADGVRVVSFTYPAAQDQYCAGAEALSLQSQEVTVLDPVCVDDDGTDWSALTPATSDEVDAQLIACSSPPEPFLPRFCALEADRGVMVAVCDGLTDAQIDEGRNTPIVVEDLPPDEIPPAEPAPEATPEPSVAPGVDPSVEPSVAPVDVPVDVVAPVTEPGVDPVEPAADDTGPNSPNPVVDLTDPSVDPTEPEPTTTMNGADDDGVDVVDSSGNPVDPVAGDSNPGTNDETKLTGTKSGSDGGCSLGMGGGNTHWLWLLALGAVFGVARRRRAG
jgi:hypothetical protein